MTKVCQITSVHPRYDGRIFRKISRSLAKAGYDVTLLCIDNKPEEVIDGVKFVPINHTFSGRLDRMMHSCKVLYKKALEIDADIYHLHDPELLTLGKKLKKKGKIVIFDSHEDVPAQIMAKTYIPAVLRKSVSNIYKIRQNQILKQLSGVIAATDYIKNILSEVNANCVSIKNYVIIDDFATMTNEEKDGVRFCYVGGISIERGLDTIIKASKNTSFVVEIAGGNSVAEQELIGYDAKNCKNIELKGFLTAQEVKDVYSKSSVGLCVLKDTPNHRNAYPIKVFEYMASGLAIICSDFPVWKKFVEENNCGLCIESDNPQALHLAMKFMVENPEKVKEFAENARNVASGKYTWLTQEALLLGFYARLIAQ